MNINFVGEANKNLLRTTSQSQLTHKIPKREKMQGKRERRYKKEETMKDTERERERERERETEREQ